jgi:hypothetical protein
MLRYLKFDHDRFLWAGYVVGMGEKIIAYRIVVEKPEGKEPLGRPRRRWVDNIRMDLREIRWGNMNWIHLTHGRDQWRALVNTVNEPSGCITCWGVLD